MVPALKRSAVQRAERCRRPGPLQPLRSRKAQLGRAQQDRLAARAPDRKPLRTVRRQALALVDAFSTAPDATSHTTEHDTPRGSTTSRSTAGLRLAARPLCGARWVGLSAESRIYVHEGAAAFPAPFRGCTAAPLPSPLRSYVATFSARQGVSYAASASLTPLRTYGAAAHCTLGGQNVTCRSIKKV
jgi:hypothetical protein